MGEGLQDVPGGGTSGDGEDVNREIEQREAAMGHPHLVGLVSQAVESPKGDGS